MDTFLIKLRAEFQKTYDCCEKYLQENGASIINKTASLEDVQKYNHMKTQGEVFMNILLCWNRVEFGPDASL